MAIAEKLVQEDLLLYEILRHPVLCSEFIVNIDKLDHEKQFEYTWYQREFLCDFNSYVSFACARSIGKSEVLVGLVLWLLINNIFPMDYILYTVPNKVHLEPIWSKFIRYFRSNSFLKKFIEPRSGINSSEFSIRLLNSTQLICRIAGQTGGGANVIGLHTPFEMVDEAGYYNWGTFTELNPTLNTFTSGYRLIVSGVPTGIRERNVCYHCDQENSSYTKHRISAFQNPRFSEEDKQRAIEQYGGEDSDDYIHLVKGEHGKPVFALFDRGVMEISNYPVYKLTLDGIKIYDNIAAYVEKASILPGLPDKSFECFFGIDLGYTEPTAMFIMYMDNRGQIRFHAKIQLSKVSYPLQEKFIDYLDTKFEPIFLGMDEGSTGKSVRQHLSEDTAYLHKDYHKRLIPIDFSSNTILGIDSNGEEIKSKTKPFATSVLQDYANNHKIIFTSTDLETITELERMTYTKTPNGEIVYRTLTERGGKKGEDHFTSALLCGMMAYYLTYESLTSKSKKKPLFKGGWFRG